MTIIDLHRTQEGFELSRPLLVPEARSFDDVLEYISEWDYGEASRSIEPVKLRGNSLGPYCRIGSTGRAMAVRPRQNLLEAVADRLVTSDDQLSFRLIVHEGRNRALLLLEHNKILGDHWIAYIDPATVPTTPEEEAE